MARGNVKGICQSSLDCIAAKPPEFGRTCMCDTNYGNLAYRYDVSFCISTRFAERDKNYVFVYEET